MVTEHACAQCGHQNPEGSQFCNRCGASMARRETQRIVRTRAEGSLATDEQIVFVIRPTMVFVVLRYLVGLILTSGLVALYFYAERQWQGQVPWWAVLITVAVVFLLPIYHHILRHREVYTLTDHRIEFTYGIIAKMRRNIPLSKIQDVTVTRTMLERLFGIGDVVIDSAAESGKIPMRNVSSPEKYADLILRQIERH
jgi:membrane protein YdbS with pleckstrin-like domain